MRYIYILFNCLLLSFVLNAQEKLNLQQCRQMAMENNKQRAISGKNTEKAAFDVKSSRANYLPKLSASGMYYLSTSKSEMSIPGGYLPTYVPDANGNLVPNIVPGTEANPVFKEYALMPDMPLELNLSKTFMGGVSLEQPLYAGGKISAAYEMSRIGEKIARTNQELTRTEVIIKTDQAYWTCIQVRELHQTALSYKTVIEELMRNVENAYDAGLKQRNDVLKVQVKLNEAELQLRRADNAIRLASMNLCQVIGLPLHTDIDLLDFFPEDSNSLSSLNNLPGADITGRPEYIMLSQMIDLKNHEIKLSRSDYLPTVGVKAGYNYWDGLYLNDDKLLSTGSFSAIVSVNIPIFEWGKGRNKVHAARVEKNIAELQRIDTEEKMTLEIVQAQNALDEAQFEVELTARSLSQAEENMRLSKNMYEGGMETLADYLEAQTTWMSAGTNYVNVRAKLELSKVEYLRAAGKL